MHSASYSIKKAVLQRRRRLALDGNFIEHVLLGLLANALPDAAGFIVKTVQGFAVAGRGAQKIEGFRRGALSLGDRCFAFMETGLQNGAPGADLREPVDGRGM